MTSRSWSNILLCTALGLVAFVSLRAPITRLARASRSQLGRRVLVTGDSAVSLDGRRLQLLSPSGLTIIAIIDARDSTTRARAAAVEAFMQWTRLQGMRPRLVASRSTAAASMFTRGENLDDQLLLADSALVNRWALTELPAVMILDSLGRVQARWLGMIPRHLEMLNVLGKLAY